MYNHHSTLLGAPFLDLYLVNHFRSSLPSVLGFSSILPLFFLFGDEPNLPSSPCSNQSTVALWYNPVMYSRTKHIEFDLFFVREKIQNKSLSVVHIPARAGSWYLDHSTFQASIHYSLAWSSVQPPPVSSTPAAEPLSRESVKTQEYLRECLMSIRVSELALPKLVYTCTHVIC